VNVTVALSLPVKIVAPLASDTNRPMYLVIDEPDDADALSVVCEPTVFEIAE
jgi:hypothetical protein